MPIEDNFFRQQQIPLQPFPAVEPQQIDYGTVNCAAGPVAFAYFIKIGWLHKNKWGTDYYYYYGLFVPGMVNIRRLSFIHSLGNFSHLEF